MRRDGQKDHHYGIIPFWFWCRDIDAVYKENIWAEQKTRSGGDVLNRHGFAAFMFLKSRYLCGVQRKDLSRAEQSRAEQSRAEQSRAEQSRAEDILELPVLFIAIYIEVAFRAGRGEQNRHTAFFSAFCWARRVLEKTKTEQKHRATSLEELGFWDIYRSFWERRAEQKQGKSFGLYFDWEEEVF
jgi:hypothetical protein